MSLSVDSGLWNLKNKQLLKLKPWGLVATCPRRPHRRALSRGTPRTCWTVEKALSSVRPKTFFSSIFMVWIVINLKEGRLFTINCLLEIFIQQFHGSSSLSTTLTDLIYFQALNSFSRIPRVFGTVLTSTSRLLLQRSIVVAPSISRSQIRDTHFLPK